ncbi:MAG: M48 family metallopeptidase [Paludibacteraceae bacterium]|nr:M48 family metallopeptidase [Paludibacteraceae bacterium]
MEIFQVNYSDGKTSRLYPAEVEFTPRALVISYLNEGVRQEVSWDIDRINTNKFGFSFEHKITYGDFPAETIEVDEDFFNQFQEQYPHVRLTNKSIHYIKKRTWRTIVFSFLGIVAFALLLYFWVVPAIADRAAQSIPISYEQQMGEKIYKQNLLEFDIDSARTKLVNEYFQTLHVKSRYPVQITVVHCDEVNAFAIPGGHIVVFSGLLNQMRNHEELAGVLSHEYAHVYYRHSLRAMARGLANYAVISFVIGDVSGITSMMVANADNIRSLQYSRELESQADDFGFKLMQQKGVNPAGMIWLFQNLTEANKEKKEKKILKVSVPEFMSTHPYTKHRIEAMKELLKKDRHVYKEDERQQVIWGLIKKENAIDK